MKHILLLTDFSTNSWEATLYALKLFKDQECVFYIMHSLEPLVSAPSTAVFSRRANETISKSRLNESQNDLENELKKIQALPKNDKHSFKSLIVHDYFFEAVKSTVQKLDIHIVIVGAKGADFIKDITIGSNTASLIRKLTCPIIAVPQKIITDTFTEIGFATDLSINDYGKGLKLFKEIAIANTSKIAIVHVTTKGTELSDYLLENKNILETTLKPLPVDFYLITGVSVELGIRAFCESRQLGMLCIINKKRSFFDSLLNKSNSKSISNQINVPLIIFNTETF